MTFSLTPAGSPAVPRAAASWVRGTALPAVTIALHDVAAARGAAATGLIGTSGLAYSVHAADLLAHIGRFRDRLAEAAGLFEAYAERLVSHEDTLLGIRAESLACGFEVVGDAVLPPVGVLDAVRWSQLASAVLVEHQSLAAWVHAVLDAAVPSFDDPDLARWVADFLSDNRVGLAAAGLEATAARGGVAMTARGLLDAAERLDHLARIPGPVSTVVDTVVALEGDHPAEGVAGVVGGVAATAVTTAALAAVAPAAPVVAVGAAAVVVGLGATYAATKAWQQLPVGFRDAADEVVAESWDGVKDDVVDAWDTTEDLADDLGDSLVAWAAR